MAKITVEKIKEVIDDMASDMECVDCEYITRCAEHRTATCMGTILANILLDMTERVDG